MKLQIITPSDSTVLDLAEVKSFIKVEDTSDDGVIQALIYAAEKQCEEYIRRFLLPTVVGLWFDLGEAPNIFCTPKGKLISVDKVATYTLTGEETVIAVEDYLVDSVSEQEGRVHFLSSHYGSRPINSLVVECTIGYADADSVPNTLIQGMNMLIAHWYENREAYEKGSVPRTIRNMWQSERIMRLN